MNLFILAIVLCCAIDLMQIFTSEIKGFKIYSIIALILKMPALISFLVK